MSQEEFQPKHEGETNKEGEIVIDLGEIKPISCPKDESFQIGDMKRLEIENFGDEGFLMSNVITRKECEHYITEGEKAGFEKMYGVRDDVRNSQRITIKDPDLANMLWDRIKSQVEEIRIDGDPHEQHIHGIPFLMQGRWKPIGLNDVFRLCRYLPGGHFAPHFDGYFMKNAEERSLKTFMLYLNSDFEDGSTNFVDESQTLYKDESGIYCAEKKNILCRIKPEPGIAILFNHHRLHEGQAVRDGTKYILRTDIMYRNKDKKSHDSTEEKALQMVQEAERREAAGDCMLAAELYRKAFKLSPAIEKYYQG